VTGRRASREDTAREKVLRSDVLATARAMSARGLSPGRSGNVSVRLGEGMLITPTGVRYDEMTPEDIVPVAADGAPAAGALKPSSEWRFHLTAYETRPDRHAVVHCHSPDATVLACARKPIPAFHYMVAVAGGTDIPCVPYATFGTEALARHVAQGLKDRDACLMASHGQIAIGETAAEALELAGEVENLAAQYVKVLLLGHVHILSAAEMAEVLERFKSYGQRAQRPD